jgi:4-hydroxy-tetrahydrodipicolinate reductase
MINLALVGYGKMGKMIESLLDPVEFNLIEKFDVINPVKDYLTENIDVAIEFTTPATVLENIEFLSSKGINIVCGTTGWYDKADEVKKIVERSGNGFIYASNFSIGVNLFFAMVKNAGLLLDKFPQYKAWIEETHHTQKLDKPSGTAIRTAEFLMENFKRTDKITQDKANAEDNELNIISHRLENVVGNHKVIFESEADSIILEHSAKSRRGFAEGALLAAKFIHNKKGFYKFEDVFNNLI